MQNRCIIRNVQPELVGGQYYIKRIPGETVDVSATIFADSDDVVKAVLAYHHESEESCTEVPMIDLGQDHFTAQFTVEKQGFYHYKLIAWTDELATWLLLLNKKRELGVSLADHYLLGSALLKEVAEGQPADIAERLEQWASTLEQGGAPADALSSDTHFLASLNALELRRHPTVYDHGLRVRVSQRREQFSTWYMLFPRSTGEGPEKPGTFRSTMRLLPRLKELGFDTLLLPPIFPIGKTNRKGPNNTIPAQPSDPGSPWSVGNEHGGHKTVNPELGTIDDFIALLEEGRRLGIEIALDLGLRCSPDHPYVKQHPNWFKRLPDGRLDTAEVPPLNYQDIANFDFETDDWKNLWEELKSIVIFWADKGVRTFYASTPHYKPFAFWHWLIAEVQRQYPEAIFLSGALARRIVVEELAMAGFNQSLTYFIWKTTRRELQDYVSELVHGPSSQFLVPNFFVNTPDIFPSYLDGAGENTYMLRYALAATLSSNCGIYGPVFELMTGERHPDSRERYFHSEKYEIARHDWEARNRLTDFITRINSFRQEYPALQQTFNLQFSQTDNDRLLSFVKTAPGSAPVWAIINMDDRHKQSGYVEVPRKALGLQGRWLNLKVRDLLTGDVYHWFNDWNYVEIDPHRFPLHLFTVEC